MDVTQNFSLSDAHHPCLREQQVHSRLDLPNFLQRFNHINLHENVVQEAHQMSIVKITHIPNVVDARHLFLPKELKDDAQFYSCQEIMVQTFRSPSLCSPSYGIREAIFYTLKANVASN